MSSVMLPAIRAGVGAVSARLPDVVKQLKATMPAVYEKMVTVTGYSNSTPEATAKAASSRKDPQISQALLGAMIQSGAPTSFLLKEVPVLTQADVDELQAMYADFTKVSRMASDNVVPRVNGDRPKLDVFVANRIERACRLLNVNSTQLADLVVDLKMIKTEDIEEYQRGLNSLGRRAL